MPDFSAFGFRYLLAGFLVLAGLGAAAQAAPPEHAVCLMLPLPAAERETQSALVIEGEVTQQRSFWDAGHRRIFTANTVRVYKLLKGNLHGASELTVLTEGGTVGDERHTLTNTLALTLGEQGVLFLTPNHFGDLPASAAAALTPYASAQGFVRYDLTDGTAAEPFRRYEAIDAAFYRQLLPNTAAAPQPVQPNEALAAAQARRAAVQRGVNAVLITSLSPATVPAGTGSQLTISGTGFGTTAGKIEFKNANDGGTSFTTALASDILSWTDSRIVVRVPSYSTGQVPAGTGQVRVTAADQQQGLSLTNLTVPYALINVQESGSAQRVVPTDHFSQNGAGGYTFRLSPNFVQNAAAAAAFQRALTEWRCQTGINWNLGDTRPANGTADDGVNSVEFDQNGELPANILGRTLSRYLGCRNADGTGLTFWVKEVDMQYSLNSGISWQFGPGQPSSTQFDFETVLLHELGHAHQLTHVISPPVSATQPGSVMHYAVGRGYTNRTLAGKIEITAGRVELLRRSFVPDACAPAPMLPAPLTAQLQATPNGNTVDLRWTVRDECNVAAYLLQRSADTVTWQPVAQMPATGTTAYTATDAQPRAGLSYYRIVVVPTDQVQLPAAPVPVQLNASAARFSVFPNPTTQSTVRLEYNAAAAGDIVVVLYDAIGRYQDGVRLNMRQAGLNILALPIGNLRAGLYVLRWEADGQKGTASFLKLE